MNFKEKIEELRGIIRERLLPIIGKKVVLVDAPYYHNIGDVLIWQGIVDFLKDNGIKLLSTSSCDTFTFPKLSKDVTILLTGGGNFGDLYRWAQNMRLNVIEKYPENRIVMFPQSVWYEDKSLIEEDVKKMSAHHDLHFCARDNYSYDFFKRYFPKIDVRLVPDMAFYINDNILSRYRRKEKDRILFLRRIDNELTSSTPHIQEENIAVRDWPTLENKPKKITSIKRNCDRVERRISKRFRLPFYKVIDGYAQIGVRESFVKLGCEFLSQYKEIITTRLHAMILGILLHKPIKIIDNSTGKLTAFANTWLKGLDDIKEYSD